MNLLGLVLARRYQDRENIEPITVAVYIKTLQCQARTGHGQAAHCRHPNAVFLAHPKKECWP
jgi:hypothetical protein